MDGFLEMMFCFFSSTLLLVWLRFVICFTSVDVQSSFFNSLQHAALFMSKFQFNNGSSLVLLILFFSFFSFGNSRELSMEVMEPASEKGHWGCGSNFSPFKSLPTVGKLNTHAV